MSSRRYSSTLLRLNKVFFCVVLWNLHHVNIAIATGTNLLEEAKAFESAKEAYINGELTESSRLLEPLVWRFVSKAENDPRSLDSLVGLDKEVTKTISSSLILYGVIVHTQGDINLGLKFYMVALRVRETFLPEEKVGFLKSNIGRGLWQVHQYEKAVKYLEEAIKEGEENEPRTWNNLGLSYHMMGAEDEAINAYDRAISLDSNFNNGELHFNKGVSLKAQGNFQAAADEYHNALGINPQYAEALINMAALYHENLMLDEAIEYYSRIVGGRDGVFSFLPSASNSVILMSLSNTAIALTEQGNALEALTYYRKVLEVREEDDDYDLLAHANMAIARKVVSDWEDYDIELEWLIDSVWRRELHHGKSPTLLPFDTLLLPISPIYRKQIAMYHAIEFENQEIAKIKNNFYFRKREFPRRAISPHDLQEGSKLRVGYFSYDFNNHPTTHLVEALFIHHNRSQVQTHALSFGKDDGSDYRQRVVSSVDYFHNIATYSHSDSIDLIGKEQDIQILVDLQGFTRGGRPEITSKRPAHISVNYLVFPGTSGAGFIDYIIADYNVIPLEHVSHYTEKIVFMPDTYQVNYYGNIKDDMIGRQSRPKELPTAPIHTSGGSSEPFIFCNFNKNDKLDPISWELWMGILKGAPNSVLWLLEPSRKQAPKVFKQNLLNEAAAQGVSPHRIIFAPRTDKISHLARQSWAGLFLDSVIYGAHSTATDAMRGGLPVLTVGHGDSFANRVGVSLLQHLNRNPQGDGNVSSFLSSMLVATSYKDFVNVAIRIATNPPLAARLKKELQESLHANVSLFDSTRYTQNLERGFRGIWEIYAHGKSPMHLIL